MTDQAGRGYIADKNSHSVLGVDPDDPASFKISEGRSVTMDAAGHILICESDFGFVRRIRFQSMTAGP